MDKQTVEAIHEYETVKNEIKKLEARIKELQPKIKPFIPADKEVQADYGVFYIQKRAKWKYSNDVEEAQEALDQMKTDEEAKGIAIPEYTDTLYYKVK